MKTKSKLKSPIMGRVAMTLLLMLVCVLSASAVNYYSTCTVPITTGKNSGSCAGGTVNTDGCTVTFTLNEGYVFGSMVWSYDQNNINITADPVSGNYKVPNNYGNVTVNFRLLSDQVEVTFNMNGYGGEVPAAQNLTFGQNVTQPMPDPTAEGLVFVGWYRDPECTVPFNFNTSLGANTQYTSFTSGADAHYNLTLYAKWLVKVEGESCGTDVTWSGYKNVRNEKPEGDITISGSGEIRQDAFINNQNIKSVVINDGVTSIGGWAFYGCSGLTSVTIGNSVTSIGDWAFWDCDGLTSVTIGNGVTSIGQGAFRGCTGLTSVTIPNSVTSIDRDAFLGCSGLTSVTIPASVTSIGQGAFYGCWGMRSLSIPASVTSIGQEAFYNCSALTSVTIPASVTSIGQRAFFKCFSLASVTIYAPLLITYGPNAFDGNADSRNIYVFSNCVDAYKAGWPAYTGYIEAIPEGNLSVNTTVNANPQATDEYWSTYYHPTANVKIKTDGVEIYKATLNNTKTAVTLTKVEDNVIKAGQAVMLKTNTSGTILMELTPVLPTGDYSDNDLKGGSTVPTGYNAYTLAAEDDQLGFYNFNGDGLNASKAHLEIPQGSTSGVREFIGFDAGDGETTGIKDINLPPGGSQSPVWRGASGYTLDGRRLSGKPTAKGIYIVKGRKLVIK